MKVSPSQFLKQHQSGILSTQSQRYPGYPFGSLVPYLISDSGQIVIYISELAEHSKNIALDNRVALTVSETDNPRSPASGARITCLAKASPIDISQRPALETCYRQRFDDAETILALPGFHFYQLELTAVRLISGFGEIAWLSPDNLTLT
jgi:hypothetical protein